MHDPPTPPATRAALLVALLALLLRLGLLAAPGEDVAPGWVYAEELHRGNVAREVLRGPLLDLQDYHHAPNVGGSLVVGILAAPFMAVLGESALAVRLPTVLLHVLAVVLLFLIADRWAGRRAAWIAGLLLAISPPGYALLSVTAWGTHHELNTLILLALFLFLTLAERGPREPGSGPLGLALGLVAGLGFYFGYGMLVALAAIGVLAFLGDRAFFLRRWFLLALAGGAAGLLLWLRYNLDHQFRALTIYGHDWIGAPYGSWGEVARKPLWFLGSYFPDALFFRRLGALDLSGAAVPVALLLGALLAYAVWSSRAAIRAAWSRIGRSAGEPVAIDLGHVCLLQAAAFLIGLCAVRAVHANVVVEIGHDGRYTAPLVPFLCLAAGLALDRIARGTPLARRAALATAALLAGVFLAGFAALADPRRFPEGWSQPGTSDEEFARWFASNYKTDLARLDRLVAGLEAQRDPDVLAGTIFVVAQTLKSRVMVLQPGDGARERHRDDCLAALAYLRERVPEAYRHYCEPPAPGEKLYSWRQREQFESDRAARRDAPGAGGR